jgi:hypothetical protein
VSSRQEFRWNVLPEVARVVLVIYGLVVMIQPGLLPSARPPRSIGSALVMQR